MDCTAFLCTVRRNLFSFHKYLNYKKIEKGSTDEDVPEAPASIKASALTAESILISWLPPTQRNGMITHYTVYSKEAGRKGQTRSKIKRSKC